MGLRNQYRQGGFEAKVIERDPQPPECLSPWALEQWNRIVAEQKEIGILSVADLEMVTAFVSAFESWRDAYIAQDQKLLSAARMEIARLGPELGRSPSGRTKMKGSGVGKKAETLDDFVNLKVKRA